MTSTMYTHHDVEYAKAGTYDFDCVGLADYFLGLGAPRALAALRHAEHIPAGYVPSPDHFADYLSSLPHNGTSLWRPITRVRQIMPGDLIIMNTITNSDDPAFVGHAMIAASPPLLLANGSYALNVFDSTGSPHGSDDTRLWDPRAVPDRVGAPGGSGLGMGTIQLWVTASGKPWRISWSIGQSREATPIEIARALR
jgi:hypothetical protein